MLGVIAIGARDLIRDRLVNEVLALRRKHLALNQSCF